MKGSRSSATTIRSPCPLCRAAHRSLRWAWQGTRRHGPSSKSSHSGMPWVSAHNHLGHSHQLPPEHPEQAGRDLSQGLCTSGQYAHRNAHAKQDPQRRCRAWQETPTNTKVQHNIRISPLVQGTGRLGAAGCPNSSDSAAEPRFMHQGFQGSGDIHASASKLPSINS